MNYTDLRSTIKTGDYGLCHGTQLASEAIELVSGQDSHVFISGDGCLSRTMATLMEEFFKFVADALVSCRELCGER